MSESKQARFQNRPDQTDLPSTWKILRASKKGTPKCCILSEEVIGCYCHYWHGRTRPCYHDDCDPCSQGNAPRWRGYLAVWTPSPSTGRLMEVTPSVVDDIDRMKKQEGSLRGLFIKLSRKGNVTNGELKCEITKQTGFAIDLPPSPNVIQLLSRIWKLTHTPLRSEESSRGSSSKGGNNLRRSTDDDGDAEGCTVAA